MTDATLAEATLADLPLAAPVGPVIDADHANDRYTDAFVRDILRDCKTIAMVGASTNANRPSYFAMKYLQKKGYRVIPVNPRAAGEVLLGERVVADLDDLPCPVDMVDIFRNSEAAGKISDQALGMTPRPSVVWMQLGVTNPDAAERAESEGCKVIMNRCPKIEFARLSGELGWNGINSRVISSRKRCL
jgi:predicted CoA-binding protein